MPLEATKSVELAREQSIQARAREGVVFGTSNVLLYLSTVGQLVAPWWSKQRDLDLDDFWKKCPHLSGALSMLVSKVATVPIRVEPRDTGVKAHFRQAEDFTIMLVEESDFGSGWVDALSKGLTDFWATDNGVFLEITGDGKKDKPIEGMPTGLEHLDSHQCTRTGDPEFPVLYQDIDGKLYKLHHTRVAFASDMPSSRARMKGVGYCATSRVLDIAQNLYDDVIYKQEKMGSRPLRAILLGKGISTTVIEDALTISNEAFDNQGFSRYAKLPLIGDIAPEAALQLLSLSQLPDGFDEEKDVTLGMFAMALGFNVPIRWIWPAAVTGATRADAMYQHIAGLGGGVGKVLRILTTMLGGSERGSRHSQGKFLPPHLKLVFDFQDDEQDRMRADIRETRAKTRATDVGTGVITVRVAREQALEDGDLTRAQFNEMELADGRTPDGADVLSLFGSPDEDMQRLLDLGVDNPLVVSEHDAPEMVERIQAKMVEDQTAMYERGTPAMKAKVEQALAALKKLLTLYEPRPPEPPKEEGEKQTAPDAIDSPVASDHSYTVVPIPCPLPGCTGQSAKQYEDHGGLCVCTECGCTFDPEAI